MNAALEKVLDRDWVKGKAWTAPGPFRAWRYINEAIYLLEDATLETDRLNILKEKNVHFDKRDYDHRLNILVFLDFLAFKRYVLSLSAKSH